VFAAFGVVRELAIAEVTFPSVGDIGRPHAVGALSGTGEIAADLDPVTPGLRCFQLASPFALFKVFSVQVLVSRLTEILRALVAVPPVFVRIKFALAMTALVGSDDRSKRTSVRFSLPPLPLTIRFVEPPLLLSFLLLSM